MVTIHRAADRGRLHHQDIESFHTFSFADYYEPQQMGFRCLRVLNEDEFRSGSQGYAPHPHRNMEILLFVVDGDLAHEDDVSSAPCVLHPGDVQGLSTGRGLVHREYNANSDAPCRILEAWFEPTRDDLEPCCQLARREERQASGRFELLASPDGRDDTVTLRQDVFVYSAHLEAGRRIRHFLDPGRAAWVQIIRGEATLNRRPLGEGDGASVENLRRLEILARSDTELMLMDLP